MRDIKYLLVISAALLLLIFGTHIPLSAAGPGSRVIDRPENGNVGTASYTTGKRIDLMAWQLQNFEPGQQMNPEDELQRDREAKLLENPEPGQQMNPEDELQRDREAKLLENPEPRLSEGSENGRQKEHETETRRGGRLSYNGFSGGMMLHAGYVSAGNITILDAAGGVVPGQSTQNIKGVTTGIGGAMKFHFGRLLRVGAEGYVTTLNYGKHGSNIRIGWGGLLADCMWENSSRFSPFAGATIGGGSAANLTLAADTPEDFVAEEGASFRKYGFMCAVPFAGVEFAATSRIRVVFKVDYMLTLSGRRPDFPQGPRFYIGFLFRRGE